MDGVIGDPAARMMNKRRADALLKFIAADHNGWVDEQNWADIVRTHLEVRTSHSLEQRRPTDPAGSLRLR